MRLIKYSFILFLTVPFSLISLGQNGKKFMSGKYYGNVSTFGFEYNFNKNMTFSLFTGGFHGYTKTLGKYTISGDSVFITSNKAQKVKKNRIISDTLILMENSCFKSKNMKEVFCKYL